MSCDCSKAKPIPSCVTALTLGVGLGDTDYIIVFKTPDNRFSTYEVTSDDFGNIIVSPTVRTNTTYEVWIAYADYPYAPSNINDKVTFAIGGTDVECIYIEFSPVYSGGDIETFATQTISLA